MAHDIGVPEYASDSIYNYMVLTFWDCDNITYDTVTLWSNPNHYMPDLFQSTDELTRKEMKERYNNAGIKIMISAFGGTSHPASEGKNAATCAAQLADYVLDHNVDGVDLDYEDNAAM